MKFTPTHGMTNTPEFRVWNGMRQRCACLTHRQYADYGGRGITVCREWDSFSKFLLDMGRRPSPRHSLDRKNNDLGYSAENCRWATHEIQMRNRRIPRNNRSGLRGVSFVSKQRKWLVDLGSKHLGSTDDFFEACCLRKSAENLHWREC